MSTENPDTTSDPAEFLAAYNRRIVADGAADMNQPIVAGFRENGGPTGVLEGAPILLLTTTGSRSGRSRTAPVLYTEDGERFVVVASRAGAPVDPAWYQNLVANPRAIVELGAETFAALCTLFAEGPEHARLYEAHMAGLPAQDAARMREYERQTSRRFPVVVLERTRD
jgi:deazaflavin-dependent oxidoreductase (nitroreductase family)